MASNLKTLINSNLCKNQQVQLEEWYKIYYINSCENNLNVCCELLKMNAKIQAQLIAIINETARESGHDDSGKSNKSQQLPQWGSSFGHSSSVGDDKFCSLQASVDNDTTLPSVFSMEDKDYHRLEPQNSPTHLEPNTTDISGGPITPREYYPLTLSELHSSRLPLDFSRRNVLVSRYTFLSASHRLDVQNLLRSILDDIEMIQRIIFICTVECFHAAKVAFIHLKLHIRQYLKPSHLEPQSLESAVIDYISRHTDYFDVQASVNEVIALMNLNEKISCSPKLDFTLMSTFCREVCNVAFAMQTVGEPLDIAFAIDGEPFDDNKYRRTYDSDFTAPLIYYHVWPALMENSTVIVKGEAVTRKRAQWNRRTNKRTTVSRSRSPSHNKRTRPSSR